MIYLMYKSAKFGLVLTVTYLQIYIYIYIMKKKIERERERVRKDSQIRESTPCDGNGKRK